MIRFLLKSVLLVVACHCLLGRCAEASIISALSECPSSLCEAPSVEADCLDRSPAPADPGIPRLSGADLPLGANSGPGTSAPVSSSSSVSPAASLAYGLDLQLRPQFEARLLLSSSLRFSNPPPSSLLEPPRLVFVNLQAFCSF